MSPFTLCARIWFAAKSIAVLGSACGLGALAYAKLPRQGKARHDDLVIFGCASGMGLYGMTAFVLGKCGMLHRATAWLMLLAGLAAGWRYIGQLLQQASRLRLSWLHAWFAPPMVLLPLAGWVACFAPPLDYDVIEYHLALPAAYFRQGRIYFIEDNMFASFPQNMEMFYLYAMHLEGGILAGAVTGKLIHFFSTGLLLMMVFVTGRRFFSEKAGMGSAYLLACVPLLFGYAIRAYVTVLLGIYTAATIYAVLAAGEEKSASGKKTYSFLCGCMAGLAAGTKYSAILLVFPVALAALAVDPQPWRSRMHNLLLYGFGFALLFSPWMARNFANTGNPFHPLLFPWFPGTTSWDTVMYARFMHAHDPPTSLGIWHFLRSAGRGLGGIHTGGTPFLLLCVPCCCLATRRHGKTMFSLTLIVVLKLLLWYGFTHHLTRFLVPCIVVLSLIAGHGLASLCSRNRYLAGIIACLAAAWVMLSSYATVAGVRPTAVFTGSQSSDDYLMSRRINFCYPAIQYLNNTLPSDAKVLYIGEACTFYSEHRHAYATVFDRHPLEKMMGSTPSLQELHQAMRARGITHIYINRPEVARLTRSYRFACAGKTYEGYLYDVDGRTFGNYLSRYTEQIQSFGKPNAHGVHPFEVYALREIKSD